MKIALVSSDQHLHKLCRQVLAGVPGLQVELSFGLPSGPPSEADLYIWDVDAGASLPPYLDFWEEHRNLFLVPRRQLVAFRERLPLAAVAVLWKPVNQVALRSFLVHALARYQAIEAARRGNPTGGRRDDRDAFLQCLFMAGLRLQEYDRDRTNFLARAVYDLRAPLTAISGYCGLLASQQLGPLAGSQMQVLAQMQLSIGRLKRLADAMFQLGIGRQADLRPRFQEADIAACIERVLDEIAPRAAEKNIRVTTAVEPPGRPLHFDPGQIEQVLVNLLDNACRFTPRNGSIEVRGYPAFWERRSRALAERGNGSERRYNTSHKPNAYRMEVADTGPGAPPEKLKEVFEEYVSYGGSQDRSGGGLGLATCKVILQAHQGNVFAESYGSGVTFVVLLPFDQPKSRATAKPPAREGSSGAGVAGHG